MCVYMYMSINILCAYVYIYNMFIYNSECICLSLHSYIKISNKLFIYDVFIVFIIKWLGKTKGQVSDL